MSTLVDRGLPRETDLAAVLLDALADDTNCMVLIVDIEGTIHWANHVTESMCAVGLGGLCGKAVTQIFPDTYATERMEHVREVASTRLPAACEGLTRGVYRRTTFRPLPASDDLPDRVLIVCRPKSSDEADIATRGVTTRRTRHNDMGPLAALSERELELLDLIGRGLTTAQIAAYLHRSAKTIEWHRVSLGEKLGVTNRVELARIALAAGLSGGQLLSAEPGPSDA